MAGHTEHTPGPWQLIVGDHGDREARIIWSLDKSREGRGELARVGNRWKPPFADDEANARLIAAAPDLLAACEAFVVATHEGDGSARREAVKMAEAALRRARGSNA